MTGKAEGGQGPGAGGWGVVRPDPNGSLDERCAWMRELQAKKTRERVPRGKYSRMRRLLERVRKVEADYERRLVAQAERAHA